jgi:predicted ABC-type transport system involved in lysophospholipase L1 biosynthesis ATPase subunit
MSAGPVLAITDLEKQYGGLRPLRVRSLRLHPGSLVVLTGLDAPAAEMFTNLVTGAILPDRGEVRLFGRSTVDVTSPDEWLRSLDRVGILTDRAVLIEGLTAAQNLAMPVTLEIDPLSADLHQAAADLANEVGLAPELLDRAAGTLQPSERLRIRFGRALALNPSLLLMEHPTASLEREAVDAFAADVMRVLRQRGLTAVAVTADRVFADALAGDLFQLRAADGTLVPQRGVWKGLRRLFGR